MTAAECGRCGTIRYYCAIYDAYACGSCDRWLEGTCSDSTCEYCTRRPETPSGCEHAPDEHWPDED